MENKLHYQFLQFAPTLDRGMIMPFDVNKPFSFFFPLGEELFLAGFNVLTPNGEFLFYVPTDLFSGDTAHYTCGEDFITKARKHIAVGDYFRLSPIMCRYEGKEQIYNEEVPATMSAVYIVDSACRTGEKKIQTDVIKQVNANSIISFSSTVLQNGKTKQSKVFCSCEDINNRAINYDESKKVIMTIELFEGLNDTQSFSFSVSAETYTIEEVKIYSSLLCRVDDDFYSAVKYKCNADEFGFPFYNFPNKYVECLLPIKIKNPQFTQNDKTYTKSNGEIVTLFAEMVKEYDGETDYITEEMHEKILIALSCDELYVNGERLTKSDKYEIDWENTSVDEYGEKTAKATFKMKSHVVTRNSNC